MTLNAEELHLRHMHLIAKAFTFGNAITFWKISLLLLKYGLLGQRCNGWETAMGVERTVFGSGLVWIKGGEASRGKVQMEVVS